MAKITIGGECFDFDTSLKPLAEALEIEAALGCRYSEWEEDVRAGSARAIAAFIWTVWHRDGRDVTIARILSGEFPVNLADLDVEPDGGDPEPEPPAAGTAPEREETAR